MAEQHEQIIKITAVNAARAAYQSVIADQKLLSQSVVQGNQQQVGAVRDFTAELAKARGEVASLSAAQRAQIDAGLKVGASYKDIAQSVGVSNQALKEYRGQADASAKSSSMLTAGLGAMRALLPGLTFVGVAMGLKSMATEAINSAGRLVDLSGKTGLSTDALQRMEHVAHQTGTELDAFTNASFKLGVNVAEGTEKVRNAVGALGLSYTELRRLKPEDQFHAVMKALEGVGSVQERNRIGVALFGKQFSEMAAAVEAGYSTIADSASVVEQAQLEALDNVGDAWTKFVDDTQKEIQRLLGTIVLLAQATERMKPPAGFSGDLATPKRSGSLLIMSPAEERAKAEWLAAGKTLESYIEQLTKARKAHQDVRLASDEAAGSTADYVQQLAAARTEVAGLSSVQRTQLNAALKLGGEAAEAYAGSIGLSDAALRLYQAGASAGAKATKASEKAMKEAETAAKKYQAAIEGLAAAQEASRHLARQHAADIRKSAQAQTDAINDAIRTNAFSRKQHEDELDRLVRQRTMSRTEFQLDEIRRWVESEKRQLDQSVENWEAAAGAIEAVGAERMFDVALGTREMKAQLAAMAGIFPGLTPLLHDFLDESTTDIGAAADATSDWTDQVGILADGFAQLGQITGGVMGGILSSVGQVIGALDLANRAAAGALARGKEGGFNVRNLGVATDLFARGSTRGQRWASGVASAGAIAQGAVNVWDATDNSRSRGGNALGGALAGAQAGAMFGPWGMAIGAAAGLVVGLVRGKPAWAKAADEVGRDFGVKISDGLAKEIEKVAKEKFKKDRQAANIFSLDQIIAEAGGVKPETLAKFTAKLHDAFSMKEMGKFTTAQVTEVLDKNFQALVDVAKQKNGLITAELREIMALNERFGTESVAISEHVKNSIGAGLQHLTEFLELSAAAAKDNAGEIAKEVAKLEKERLELTDGLTKGDGSQGDEQRLERDKQRITEITKQIAELQDKMVQAKQLQQGLAITNAGSASAFASAIAGSFQKLLAEGVDPMQAIGQVEPAVLALQGQLDKLGIDGGEAFKALRAQIAMTRDEVAGPMVGGMRALGSSITELYNAGILTEDMFVGMTAQIGQTFQALVAQGHNGRTAMSLMKPQLQAIWELQQRFGGELDEATQKLLDEAEAAGIVGDKHKNASERMVDGIGKVVDRLDRLLVAMGVELPDAVDDAAREIENKARDMRERIGSIFDDIPDKLRVDVDVNATYNRREGTNTTQPEGDPVPGAARGVYATRPMLRVFGEGGEPELGGPIDFMTRALQGAMSRTSPDFHKEPAGKQPIEVIVREIHNHPMLTVTGFGLSVDDIVKINEQHLAQGGLMGNAGGSATLPGLREQVVDIVREVVRQELARV